MFFPGLIFVAMACGADAQQGPGMPYPLQLFHLAPSAAALLRAPPQQLQAQQPQPQRGLPTEAAGAGAGAAGLQRMVPPAALHRLLEPDVDDDSDASDLGRFQISDGAGREVFGYLLPDQTRVEQRSADGSVHGAYSYLSDQGLPVKVRYWDAGAGFHAATNHLPAAALGLPLPPQDTAEVQAARDAHLQQVEAALLQHAAVHERLQMQRPQRPPHPQPHAPPPPPPPPAHHPALSDGDSLVVESDGHQEPVADDPDTDAELTRYPDLGQVPQALYDPTHVHDADLEAVIVDAAGQASQAANAARAHARPRTIARALGKSTDVPEKKAQEPQKESTRAASTLNTYYSLWHTVPMYVEVKTVQDEPEGKSNVPEPLSVSQKASLVNAKLPSAVHSFQVPPSKAEAVLPQLPIFLSPHDTLPLSYSAKASYFHSVPVAAVHDTQVHPQQRGAILDHQIQPVFHLTPSDV